MKTVEWKNDRRWLARGLALCLAAFAILLFGATAVPAAVTERGTMQVVAARDLAGRGVRDRAGVRIGEVGYVLVDPGQGRLQGVAIETAQNSDKGLLVVPWRSVDLMASDHGLILHREVGNLDAAIRVKRETLADLTKPSVWTQVTAFWGDEPDASATASKSDAAAKAGGPTAGAEAKTEGNEEPHLVVGRSVLQVLMPPDFRFASQMSGATVLGRDDEPLGEIDEVVLDWKNGRVAYIVIAQGGFLGLGRTWLPVPPTAIAWNADDKVFRLTAREQALEQMKPLDASITPIRVPYADLRTLYERFSAPLYWEKEGAAAS